MQNGLPCRDCLRAGKHCQPRGPGLATNISGAATSQISTNIAESASQIVNERARRSAARPSTDRWRPQRPDPTSAYTPPVGAHPERKSPTVEAAQQTTVGAASADRPRSQIADPRSAATPSVGARPLMKSPKVEAAQKTTVEAAPALAPPATSNTAVVAPRTTPIAPRALVEHFDNLAARSVEAERERARAREASRRVQELQNKAVDLEARLELERRAKFAAEERAQAAYDQGYQYGVQVMQAQMQMHMQVQAFGYGPVLPGGMMPFHGFQDMSYQPTPAAETPIPSEPQSLPQKEFSVVRRRKDTSDRKAAAPEASQLHKYTGASEETAVLGGMLDDLVETGPTSEVTAVTPNVQQTASSPVDQGSSSSRVDSAADPRLKSLRERALATTAAYRDKQAANK